MKNSISEVAIQFGFSRTTILRVHCEYHVSGKTSILWQWWVGKRPWKTRDVDDWREYLNEIDVQHFLKLLRISKLTFNKLRRTNCSTDRHWYGLLEPQGHSCIVVDCTVQSFTLCWTHQHLYWTVDELLTHHLVWWVSFLIVPGG